MIYLTVASKHTAAVLEAGEMGALLQPGSNPWRPRAEGWRPAFVAQEGATPENVPWDEFDCLFVGGKEEAWKLGSTVVALVQEARARGKWTHLGRVNSWKRLDWGRYHQMDSADGTIVAVAPDRRLPEARRWVRRLADAQPLFVSP